MIFSIWGCQYLRIILSVFIDFNRLKIIELSFQVWLFKLSSIFFKNHQQNNLLLSKILLFQKSKESLSFNLNQNLSTKILSWYSIFFWNFSNNNNF
ncbi:MAG: hypothetical protein ACD_4C00042G0001, partial [uncultured bacterium (gcode 4)]